MAWSFRRDRSVATCAGAAPVSSTVDFFAAIWLGVLDFLSVTWYPSGFALDVANINDTEE
jgi:hypothetical protein